MKTGYKMINIRLIGNQHTYGKLSRYFADIVSPKGEQLQRLERLNLLGLA